MSFMRAAFSKNFVSYPSGCAETKSLSKSAFVSIPNLKSVMNSCRRRGFHPYCRMYSSPTRCNRSTCFIGMPFCSATSTHSIRTPSGSPRKLSRYALANAFFPAASQGLPFRIQLMEASSSSPACVCGILFWRARRFQKLLVVPFANLESTFIRSTNRCWSRADHSRFFV